MDWFRKCSHIVSSLLVVSVTCLSLPLTAHGAMVSTAEVLDEQTSLNRNDLAAALDRTEVQEQLVALGVDLRRAKERVAALTDDEISALNGKLEEMPAGGDAFGGLIGAALFVFIVLLITDIVGLTDVFTFVKKPVRHR